jgi:Domain of unknown function (DUF3601)
MTQLVRGRRWGLISALLVIGAVSATVALWLGFHQMRQEGSALVVASLLGIYFVSWTCALLLYLRWRDGRRAVAGIGPTYAHELEGTVYSLVQRAEYRVLQSFTDYYANEFQCGELLRFKERHFLPYEGGHTIIFDERSLYLHEEQNRSILEHFSDYIVPIKP